ncbi:hypothetical protein U9R90_18685 [Streptomyces sp. E11-3]|uniref:hypothetical protein n=1 Tax=Streptomyces sp. E11-3 TaxID=3110112 RepID=UPI00397EEA09
MSDTQHQPSLIVEGLRLIEFHELSENLPEGAIRKQPPPATTDTHGELGTIIAILTLTTATLQTLAAWLQTRQARSGRRAGPTDPEQSSAYTIERRADGTVVLRVPRLTDTQRPASSEPAGTSQAPTDLLRDLQAHIESLFGPSTPE